MINRSLMLDVGHADPRLDREVVAVLDLHLLHVRHEATDLPRIREEVVHLLPRSLHIKLPFKPHGRVL